MVGDGGEGGISSYSTIHAQTWPRNVDITPEEALVEYSLQHDLTSLLLQRGALGCTTPRSSEQQSCP